MIDILKGKYEEVALKLQEETQEKERILAELRTLQKRGSSTDVLEAALKAKANKEGDPEKEEALKEKDAEIEALNAKVGGCDCSEFELSNIISNRSFPFRSIPMHFLPMRRTKVHHQQLRIQKSCSNSSRHSSRCCRKRTLK
jgi:hypothetical protein